MYTIINIQFKFNTMKHLPESNDACFKARCYHGGSCVEDDSHYGYHCACKPGFYGRKCQNTES